jgi:N4-(beta-N-acetylglucosaminyl)-L-asparaginase
MIRPREVSVTEDVPTGTGVTLDACIMDENYNIGSVACLEHIKNPISVARAVMEKTPHVMLVGDGALQFAVSQGFKKKIF